MIIQFTLHELMIFLLCALGITVALLMIPVLLNIKKVTGSLRATLTKNQESIQKTFTSLPGILEDVGYVSSTGKEITNQLKVLVPVIAHEVEDISHAAQDGIELAGTALENIGFGIKDTVASFKDISESETDDATGFMVYVPLIKEVLQVISNIYQSRK